MDNKERQSIRMKIFEIYEKLVEDKIWNEYIYLQHVNIIKEIKDENLKDVLWYLQTQDDY